MSFLQNLNLFLAIKKTSYLWHRKDRPQLFPSRRIQRMTLKCLRSWSRGKMKRSGTAEISRVRGDPNLARVNFSGGGLKTYERFRGSSGSREVRSSPSCARWHTPSHTRAGIAGRKRGIFTLRFSHLIHIKVARKQEGSIVTSTMIGHSRSLPISPSLGSLFLSFFADL